MDIDGMVKVNGHCALVEIGEAGYYTLGPEARNRIVNYIEDRYGGGI